MVKKTEYNQSTIKLQSIQNPKWDILFLFFYLGFLSYTLAFTRTTGEHACFISKWSGNLTDQIPEKWRYKKKKKNLKNLNTYRQSFKKHWKAYLILLQYNNFIQFTFRYVVWFTFRYVVKDRGIYNCSHLKLGLYCYIYETLWN